MTAADARAQLESMAEPSYRDFSSRLIPGCGTMLGVRLPRLRALASQAAKGDWRAFLLESRDDTFEETMLQGMVIGAARAVDLEERLRWVAWFVPKLCNWSVCDSFCAGLSFVKTAPERVWSFLQPYFAAEAPFARRFAVVMTLDWYSKRPEYAAPAFERFRRMPCGEPYVMLAVAWALSVFCISFPAETTAFLRDCPDDALRRKAIRKICESRRIPPERKQELRRLGERKPPRGPDGGD